MLRSAIGHAEGIDVHGVVGKVLADLADALSGDTPSALFVFSSSEFDPHATLRAITGQYPGVPLVGGTTLGEFSSEMGLSDDSIVIAALVSDSVSFASGVVREEYPSQEDAVRQAWETVGASLEGPPKVCLVFPDSETKSVGGMLHMFGKVAGDECVVAGGLAGKSVGSLKGPFLFHGDEVLTGGVVFMLVGGAVVPHVVVCQNWMEIGSEGTVTSADGVLIKTINDEPAVVFYRRQLGPDAPPLPEFPLSIRDGNTVHPTMRGVLGIDEASGSLRVSDEVGEGGVVRLAKARPQYLLEGVYSHFRAIPREVIERSALVLSFSCGARRWLMGTETHKEVETIELALKCRIPLVGFYSFGEVGPVEEGAMPVLHNHTLVSLLLAEDGPPNKLQENEPCLPSFGSNVVLDSDQDEIEFLQRKLGRAEFNLENMEKHRAGWFALMFNLQQGLRKSEEKYRRIVESCADGFLLLGTDRTIEYVNDAWLKLTGFARKDVIGYPVSRFTDENRLDGRLETTLVHKNGRDVPVLINGNILTGDSGEMLGFFVFATDLTAQKKALRLAGQFQQSLLPSKAPDIPGLDLAGRSVPCDEVGGDYFDYISSDKDNWALVVADVSGHGVDASLLMSSVRTYLRSHPSGKDGLADTVSKLNAQLAQDLSQTGRFVTLFHLLTNPATGDLAWVRAGHDPAWVYDISTDAFSTLDGEGLPLGVLEDTRYSLNVLNRRLGDTIIIMATDGIWESRNIQGEMFGKARFQDVIRRNGHKDAQAIRDCVFEAVRQYTRGTRILDDLTLVVAKFA
jgi:PAS domain S-box-containing protein